MAKAEATVTSKGQLTLPSRLRKALGIKPGDMITFDFSNQKKGEFAVSHRRSIFEMLETMPSLSMDRPVTQADIDDAVGEEMINQEERIKRQYSR